MWRQDTGRVSKVELINLAVQVMSNLTELHQYVNDHPGQNIYGDPRRHQREVIAIMRREGTCEDFVGFLDDLPRTFNEITIKLERHTCSQQRHPAYEMNRPRYRDPSPIDLEILIIDFDETWCEYQQCPLFVLLNHLLPAIVGTLREFSIFVKSDHHLFLQNVLQMPFQYQTFPKLRTLEFPDVLFYTTSAAYKNIFRELVSRAPSLKTVCTRGCVYLNTNRLQEYRAVHDPNYPGDDSIINSLRMGRMNLIGIGEDFDLQRFNVITFRLLDESRNTLTWMKIDLPFLLLLMHYRISLRSVGILEINTDPFFFFRSESRKAWDVLKRFNFRNTFPNLDSVTIIADLETRKRQIGVLSALISMVGEVQDDVAPDRAANITELIVKWDGALRGKSLQPLAQMFPNLYRVSIEAKEMISFKVIWSSWLDLGELRVTLREAKWNLDSIFCGIFPEEVAKLREEDDKYLKAVNIVPVMPSITCLRNLWYFDFDLRDPNLKGRPLDDDHPYFLFSKVTPLIALRNQNSKDNVKFRADSTTTRQALSHLEDHIDGRLYGG